MFPQSISPLRLKRAYRVEQAEQNEHIKQALQNILISMDYCGSNREEASNEARRRISELMHELDYQS